MSPYTRWRARLEASVIAAGVVCALGLLCGIVQHAETPLDWLLVALSFGAGYLMADFVTGVIHWAGDRLGSPSTPVLGPAWIAPFRVHHSHPDDILNRSFVELCGSSFLAVTPVWAAFWFLLLDGPGTGPLVARALLLSLGIWTGVTNQFHHWAHVPAPGPIIAALQRAGLILSPARHALHHTPPFKEHYCVTTGWLNRFLLHVRFFDRLEALIRRGPHVASGERASAFAAMRTKGESGPT